MVLNIQNSIYKVNFRYILILIMSCVLLAFGLPKNIQKKVDKEIKIAFELETFKMSSKLFPEDILSSLPAKFGEFNLFEIKSEENRIGYAYVGKAPSKTDQFDYLILFDINFIIVKSKVLIYREDYGGEIGSKRWLKQFIGKNQNDNLKLHQNIVAISGATISVKSMTIAVNNVLASLKILHQKELL